MNTHFKKGLGLLTAAVFSAGLMSTSSYAATGDAEYAVVLKVLSTEFWQTMKSGIEQEAQRLGVSVDVYAANSEDDVEGQTMIMESAVNKGYKGIAFAPISPDNLIPAIADASSRGIFTINIDELVNISSLNALGGKICGFVATDNVDVGRIGAQYIIDRLGGRGKVAIIEGKADSASGEDRRRGAADAFNAAAGIELVETQPADWSRTRAYDVATDYLNKYPDLVGIYCCNDTMAMGAQAAVSDSGRQDQVLIVGTDGNSDAVASVNRGELAATVRQRPNVMGARGLELLVEAATSGKIPDEPIQERVDAELVTKEVRTLDLLQSFR